MDRKIYYLDLIERVAWTFLQAAAAFWVVTGALDAETLYGALVAGGIAVAKALAGTRVGDRDSAATLPSPPDHAPGE